MKIPMLPGEWREMVAKLYEANGFDSWLREVICRGEKTANKIASRW